MELGNSNSNNKEIDEVDKILATQDGKIERRAGKLCGHGPRQKCTNCLPLDPYDESYLNEKGIKHLSFHSYVKKLTNLRGGGTQLNKPLENISCKLKQNCSGGHRPYPAGICAKCRPPVLTLMRQVYRHVDNVMIENSDVVDQFLDYWRQSSCQRIGFLIGRYEPYGDVPMGIRAVVTAIYEPPQSSSNSNVSFDKIDPHIEAVDRLCSWLGMKRVGWIFTDLWTDGSTAGNVHCTRHEESFLLSAHECVTAGYLQSQFKNYTTYCSDGHFGSKFVTLVASGDRNKQVHLSGYQVSNQCTALVEAEILCPTRNNPELAWVRETPLNESQYITEVQYSEKNEYGLEVKRNGRPMPVEYLLVDVPTATPLQPLTTFEIPPAKRFPIENRPLIGELQDLKTIAAYMAQFEYNNSPVGDDSSLLLRFVSNFHFLLFLLTNDYVVFTDDEIEELAQGVITKDQVKIGSWARKSANWQKLYDLIKKERPRMNSVDSSTSAVPLIGGFKSSTFRRRAAEPSIAEPNETVAVSASISPIPIDIDHNDSVEEIWSCEHCTFENTGTLLTECAMCNLPRSGQ